MPNLSDEEFASVVARELTREVGGGQLALYYLSFADQTGFLGAVVLEAFGFTDAISQAIKKGINPGGECLGEPWPEDVAKPAPEKRNRLLTKEEALALP